MLADVDAQYQVPLLALTKPTGAVQAATEELAARNDDLAAAEAVLVAKEKEVRI